MKIQKLSLGILTLVNEGLKRQAFHEQLLKIFAVKWVRQTKISRFRAKKKFIFIGSIVFWRILLVEFLQATEDITATLGPVSAVWNPK